MPEELVWTRSEDGLQLEGLACTPPAGVAPRSVAVVLTHGLASRFYSHSVALVARGLAARGYPAVSGNNRGHDYGAFLSRADGRLELHGAAWEDVGECVHDLGAWVGWAVEHFGRAGVVLVGHSVGGLKSAAYQAERQDTRVRAVALLSPAWRATPSWWRPELAPQAANWVMDGRGRELLPEELGWIGRVSARTFLGRAPDRWPGGLPALIAHIDRPLFVSYGTENDIGGAEQLAAVPERATKLLLEGADHNYTGRWDELAGALAGWLGGLGL